LESVGKPIAGVEVGVYADDGQPAQVDQIGEIAVKSAAAIARYDGDPSDHTSFRNGYFFTGDVGRRDAAGLLYLTGRKKFFINKGGYKINPREIEQILESHPSVEEAVVVGLSTLFGDEKVKAIVVTNHSCTEREIIEHCKGKIADFKIPSVVEFADQLPKSATGKVRRALLTEAQEQNR
jgi:long-chain acyl-CoA synthetase